MVGVQRAVLSTCFETSGRFTLAVVNSGVNTFGTGGFTGTTGATQASYFSAILTGDADVTGFYADNPMFSAVVEPADSAGSDFDLYFGMGDVTLAGTGNTYTPAHFGFKHERAASGTSTITATNGNASTETATDLETTITAGTTYKFTAIKTDTTNIKYYINKTLKATHTGSLPTAAEWKLFQITGNNVNVASATQLKCPFVSMSWDAI